MRVTCAMASACVAALMLAGCGGDGGSGGAAANGTPGVDGTDGNSGAGDAPAFSLAWSEYPSWSVFGVAHEKGLLNKEEGQLGEMEKKWGVDVVLRQLDYDPCLTAYGTGEVDAVCMTNMDALAPAGGIASVAILPTSTSVGADACITAGVEDLAALRGVTTYGLERSVSQYAFERCLEKQDMNPADFPFANMDPGIAATAMQSGDEEIKSIMVWNPFAMQTLRDREGSKRLFDSSMIPEEIIDMVVLSKSSLEKPGGEAFAHCLIDTFYAVNGMLAEGAEGRDETLVMLGEKFSSLGLEDMKQVVTETRMYADAVAGQALFNDEAFRTETMPTVVKFCVDHEIIDEAPTLSFGDDSADLEFIADYMKGVAEKK